MQPGALKLSGCPHSTGRSSASLIVDSLGWFCLYQFSFQETESAVAPQNFDSLLLYRGWSDTQILQTGQSGVLQVCCVKLEKQSTWLGIELLKVSSEVWQEDQDVKTWQNLDPTLSTLSGVVQGSNGFIAKNWAARLEKYDQNWTVLDGKRK